MKKPCKNCSSEKIVIIQAHCCDSFCAGMNKQMYYGYVPSELRIGGGDDVGFKYCLDCGMIQGNFPATFPIQIKR